MGDLNELVEIAGYRARFDATETGFAFPWDYSAKDPTPYCVYDVVEPLVRQSDHLAALTSLIAERDGLRDLADRLKLEAQCHAGEARGANHTIYEIYQVLSGATGEPGNWNGAEPARQYVAKTEAQLKAAREALEPFARYGDLAMRGRRDDFVEVGISTTDDAGEPAEQELTAGDFRRACAALSLDTNKGDGKP